MEFLIDKAITPDNNPHNTYRLHVVGMSGDADHYETNTCDYDSIEEMLPVFNMMIRGFQAARYYDSKVLVEALEQEGEQIGDGKHASYARDIYSGLVGYDVTREGELCMPDMMYVTWFNDFGVEHEVSIILDDSVLDDSVLDGSDEPIKKVTDYYLK